MSVELTVQYFDGCPHWREADRLLAEIVYELDLQTTVRHQIMNSPELAEKHSFRGSPTILINGTDPFAEPDAPIGLSCRLYTTPSGPRGTPTRQQLIDHLRPWT